MIVVDASAAVNAFAYADARGCRARAALTDDPHWVVPDHWHAEVFSAIRGLTMGEHLTDEDATRALARLGAARVQRVAVEKAITPMWSMRHSLSGYDAPYVAWARILGLTLITADRRLARGAAEYCRVQLV